MYTNTWFLVICFISPVMCSTGQQQTSSSGNDYHCNPSIHFHPCHRHDGYPVYESTASICHQTEPLPRDCTEVKSRGNTESGQYLISPQDDGPPFRVYCDMDTEDAAWLVFQRREDGAVNFYRNWVDYQDGFGNTNSEHWLGNEKIHRITAQARYELRVDLTDFDGNTSYAKYTHFRLGDSGNNYTLIVGTYSGTAGDGLSPQNGSSFTTKDRDNDIWHANCAQSFKGAWWYSNCHNANLNAQYLRGAHQSYADGVNWSPWKGQHYSLKTVEMKIKVAS